VGGVGISAETVTRCDTHECLAQGIFSGTVSDSHGETVGTNSTVAGIQTTTANNCYGYSSGGGIGIASATANNCYGYSAGGKGILVTGTATSCYGQSTTGAGLAAFIANVCHGSSVSGTPLIATYNVNSY
jgi:hypothetical protein